MSPHLILHLFHFCPSTILVESLFPLPILIECLTLISVSGSPALLLSLYLILSESLFLLSLSTYLSLALFYSLFFSSSLSVSSSLLSLSPRVSCFSPLFPYPRILTLFSHNLPATPSNPPASDTLVGLGLPTPLMAGAQATPPCPVITLQTEIKFISRLGDMKAPYQLPH